MINNFNKDYLENPIVTLLSIDPALPIPKLTTKPISKPLNAKKRKYGRPVKAFVKQIKKF